MKSNLQPIAVFGAGGHAKIVIDAIECFESQPDIFLVDSDPLKNGTLLCGYQIFASLEDLPLNKYRVVVAIGVNKTRLQVAGELTRGHVTFTKVVHPFSVLSANVEIGVGTVVFPGAVVNRDASIGKHCIINTNCSVDHDCTIADGVHIGPGATLCGTVDVGTGTLIGAGATIMPNIRIGKNSVIGAGTTIWQDIDSDVVVYTEKKPHIRKL